MRGCNVAQFGGSTTTCTTGQTEQRHCNTGSCGNLQCRGYWTGSRWEVWQNCYININPLYIGGTYTYAGATIYCCWCPENRDLDLVSSTDLLCGTVWDEESARNGTEKSSENLVEVIHVGNNTFDESKKKNTDEGQNSTEKEKSTEKIIGNTTVAPENEQPNTADKKASQGEDE